MKIITSLSTEDLSYYLGLLSSLSNIANPEFPGKFWIDENGSQYYAAYGEMYNCFMSPAETILTWPELSRSQRNNLAKLCEILENYEDYLSDRKKTDEEIRDDPEWDKIRKFSQQLYEELKHVKFISS